MVWFQGSSGCGSLYNDHRLTTLVLSTRALYKYFINYIHLTTCTMTESKLSSEVATQLDLSVIRYSRVLEDHRVLSEALNIVPEEDVVLSIARLASAN